MRFLLISCLAAGCLSSSPTGEDVESLTQVTSFGSNPGKLNMYLYAPAGIGSNAPLVVAMHGCTQSAADYVGAGWNELADKWKFYVLYPEQVSANSQQKCFDWFTTADITRGAGEALSIKQMVDYATSHYEIDAKRVYVTGLSAGAAMTAVMLATYPDVFSGGAIMSGLPYACATTQNDAYTCMNQSKDLSAKQWGDLVRSAYPSYSGPYPRVAVWQGDADYTVRPANADELVTQWTNVNGITGSPSVTETVDGATHKVYVDAAGLPRVESYLIPKMGHGTAIKPGFAPAGGCGQAGAYILDAGICSTYYAGKFFGLDTSAGGSGSGAGSDPGVPPPPDAGSATPPPAFPCQEFNATNYAHVQAGRAVRCGAYSAYVCAVGSGDQLGLWNLMPSWIKETKDGYYEAGRCN